MHSDDFLDALHGEICSAWQELGGAAGQVELASERSEIAVERTAEPALRPAGFRAAP